MDEELAQKVEEALESNRTYLVTEAQEKPVWELSIAEVLARHRSNQQGENAEKRKASAEGSVPKRLRGDPSTSKFNPGIGASNREFVEKLYKLDT